LLRFLARTRGPPSQRDGIASVPEFGCVSADLAWPVENRFRLTRCSAVRMEWQAERSGRPRSLHDW
jgi:hypothetical protein